MNKINYKEPIYYHREYANDIGVPPTTKAWTEQSNIERLQRIANVALPFITLYKPLSFSFSLGMNGIRTVASLAKLANLMKTGESKDIAHQILQTSISVASLAGTIFAHPIGMAITTGQDLLIDLSKLARQFQEGEYKQAFGTCGSILNNSLYMTLLLHGGLEVSIASLGMQTLLGIYHAQDAIRQENYLEAAGHLGMAMVRGNQMMDQISILNYKWKLESLTKKFNDNQVKATRTKYWELTPATITKMNGKTIYLYPATVLGTKQIDGSSEILLNITSHDGGKFTQAWFKTMPGQSDSLKGYSLGDKIVINIDPLQPQEASISSLKTFSEAIPVKTYWPHTEKKNWVIDPKTQPLSDAVIALEGTEYAVYAGEVLRSHYETPVYENSSDDRYMIHILDIEVAIQGDRTKHYVDHRRASAFVSNHYGQRFDSEAFQDDILRMLRKWTPEDRIKILVNQYYPGFWWILNESRSEAAYIAQGQAQTVDYDLWHRLTN